MFAAFFGEIKMNIYHAASVRNKSMLMITTTERVNRILHGEAACLFADNTGGVGGMASGIAGGIGAGVGGVMSIARQQFERRFTDVSYDLLISKTFYFFFYAAFGSVAFASQQSPH